MYVVVHELDALWMTTQPVTLEQIAAHVIKKKTTDYGEAINTAIPLQGHKVLTWLGGKFEPFGGLKGMKASEALRFRKKVVAE